MKSSLLEMFEQIESVQQLIVEIRRKGMNKPKFLIMPNGDVIRDDYQPVQLANCPAYLKVETARLAPFPLSEVHKQVRLIITESMPSCKGVAQ